MKYCAECKKELESRWSLSWKCSVCGAYGMNCPVCGRPFDRGGYCQGNDILDDNGYQLPPPPPGVVQVARGVVVKGFGSKGGKLIVERGPVKHLDCGCTEYHDGHINRLTRDVCQVHRPGGTFRNELKGDGGINLPEPGSIGTPKGERLVIKPAMPLVMSEKMAKDYERMMARAHADGCPCWTCKGVPSKQTKKV